MWIILVGLIFFNLIKMLGFKIKNKINLTKLVGFIRVEYQYHNLSHHIYIDKKHTKKRTCWRHVLFKLCEGDWT